MSYEHKPGSLSLFKNEKKEEGKNHPDFAGSGMDLQGNIVYLSAWLRKSEGRQAFISIAMKPKDQDRQEEKSSIANELFGDDLTF